MRGRRGVHHARYGRTLAALVLPVVLAGGALVWATAVPAAADPSGSPTAPFGYRAIAVGGGHMCVIVHDASVKCWGANNSGQLGLGDTAARGDGPGEMGDNLPAVNLGTGRTATAIVAGASFTCARLDNGTVKCWGANSSGQLGLGDTAARGDGPGEMGDNLPAVNLGTGRTALGIAAGNDSACALLDNATVRCWGENQSGRLGLGDTADRGDGPAEMGDALPTVALGIGRSATAISAGGAHACALLNNGTVKCWGHNTSGQLGVGDVFDRGDSAGEMGDALPAVSLGTGRTATTISVGSAHSCARLDNGTVKCWGEGGAGQLGLGNTLDRGDGPGELGDALPAVSLGTGRTVVQVSAAAIHTCAVLDNATVKCWGQNTSGQVGTGAPLTYGDQSGEMGDALPAVPLGIGHTATAAVAAYGTSCARLENGALKCWGENQFGELGLGDMMNRGDSPAEMGEFLPGIELGSSRTLTSVAPGQSHTCGLLDNATVKCWGANNSGQLGLGDTVARGDAGGELGDRVGTVALGTGRTATAVVSGNEHTCALLDNGTVKCWGANSNGQLGLGDTNNRGDGPGEMGDALPPVNLGTGRTAIALAAGTAFTCARLDNGSVKCWGLNGFGQLGVGDTQPRGDQPGEMGDALPAAALGTGRTATAIAAGSDHVCARLDNATLKCWGRNTFGQLGLGDGNDRGDAPGDMGDALPAVALGSGRTATSVSGGLAHTCARLDNGSVKCWGGNAVGQLGLGDTTGRGDDAGEMGDALPSVSLGTGRTAVSVSAGAAHTCARLDNAKVKCWGTNSSGRLGVGDVAARGDGPGEMGDSLPVVSLGQYRTATAVSAGNAHSCVRLDDARVKCWGANGSGQLGVGDVADRGDSAGEMGDFLAPVDVGAQAPTGLAGTVLDATSAAAVPGALVVVMRSSDYSLVIATVADGSGNYTVPVAPGPYFVYLVDPAGAHTAAFHGAPATVTVPSDTVLHLDPHMTPTRGSVVGTVTETGPATPIGGAVAISLDATTGAPERAVVANGAGAFTLAGLDPGNHFIGYLDPNGNHATRFFPNSPSVPGATPVAVTAGGVPVANGSLPQQTPTGPGAALTGTVIASGTAAPLAGVLVIAMHAADFRLARAGFTSASGQYNLDVQAGSYKLVFLDPSGLHDMEWFDNQPYSGIAAATTVIAPGVADAALAPRTGSMAGTVIEEGSLAVLRQVSVLAIGPTGITGGAITDDSGHYSISGLAPGTYRAVFLDPTTHHVVEYWNNSPDYAGATPFAVTAGAATTVDIALAVP